MSYEHPNPPASTLDRLSRLGWLPIALLALAIGVLWALELQSIWSSDLLNKIFYYGGAALGVGFVVAAAGRSFATNPRLRVLMLGCGALVAAIGSAALPTALARDANLAFAIFNTSVLLSAVCHFAGVAIRPWSTIRPRHPVLLLGAAYAGAAAVMGMVVWLALSGRMPLFFIEGLGSAPLRALAVGAAAGVLFLTAGLLWRANRATNTAFLYWYALGLVLWGIGLAGSLLIVSGDSLLHWAVRLTQFFAIIYLGAAAVASGQKGAARRMTLREMEEAWRERPLVAGLLRRARMGWAVRYGLAIVGVAAGVILRRAVESWVGPGLPPYITFYPVIMVVALLGGFGPGFLATALSGYVVAYWILSPLGRMSIDSSVDRLGLVIFLGMGIAMSVVADLYQRNRGKAAAYDHEAALRESRARLAAFAAATFEGIIESEGGRIVDCNEQFARMLGYSVAELRGMARADLIAPEDRARVLAETWRIREPVNEHALLRKDGTRIFVETRGRPVSGTRGRRHTAVRDITERKRSEEQLRATLESIGDGFFACDEDWRFVYVNAPAERLLGIRRDDVLGKSHWDVFPQTRGTELEKEYRRAAAGEARDFENFYEPWGRWFHNRCFPREGGGLSVYFEDVTDRKRAEEALRHRTLELQQLTATLEQRVQDRTAELRHAYESLRKETEERQQAEHQLRQAQKMQAIGTLAGGIAHDFNNILATIVINSELGLLDTAKDSEVHNNLEMIFESGLHGKDLVSQLLLFSRKSEQARQVVALGPVINETFRLLRASIPSTIQMKFHLETETDTVLADPSQIQQVIMNLCTNAAYAMREATGSIDISLRAIRLGPMDLPEEDMRPGDYLLLEVQDSGAGMDAELKKRIFEPFFTTKPVGEGTGLGLSVVYGIVKGHGGGITVTSEPGQGSTFRVYLPRAEGGESTEVDELGPIPGGQERILLVDDEELMVKSIGIMLEHLGYKVTPATDSRAALELFSRDPGAFDLVITDQTMPSLTGEALGKEMKRLRPGIPVILCTGYSDLISPDKALRGGFGYLLKPFTLRDGAEVIRRVLDQSRPLATSH